jgi:HAD superfamily hydrolase (TIGR01509 family)
VIFRRCAASASSDLGRHAQKDDARDQDEADEKQQDRTAGASEGRTFAETPERDIHADRADHADDAADRDHAKQHALKFRIHVTDTTTTRPHGFPAHVDAAIFDFDETMIDLEAEHTYAHAALCRDYGARYDAMPEEFRRGSGRRIIDDIREMKQFFGWTDPVETLFRRRHEHFLHACRTQPLKLMAGVVGAVHALRDRGLTLAVTSSAVGDAIDEILRRFGIRDCFALIVEGRDVNRGKPDPEPYLLTAVRLRIPPSRAIVFEDANVGVLAAKAAGMYCIAVRNPKAQMFQDLSAADVELRSFEEFDPNWIDTSS